jgi:PPOX class probable FMN-dependent enzyme
MIGTVAELEALYGQPTEPSVTKVVDRLTPEYRKLIAASPFAVLATSGPDGLDCSPRGDAPGFVRVLDDRTLMLPDRRGNNRIDSLRNVIADSRVGLLFMIPGSGTTLRVNGRAQIAVDVDLLASFAVDGKAPRSVLVITMEAIYFQCARAIMRSDLWNADKQAAPGSLPTPGQILSTITNKRVGGEAYDEEWPIRAKQSMW